MSWWVIELGTTALLIVIVVVLGPLIKRFGRAYAGDVFRANPRTGKSFLVLMDVAYYLIFIAYILFSTTLARPPDWRVSIANQLQAEVFRVGGMLLLMGVLHGANVLSLPIVGRLLGLGRQLDEDTPVG
jgi:NADH:ubiquinone oxidoreductase subunit 3 (subunit A)